MRTELRRLLAGLLTAFFVLFALAPAHAEDPAPEVTASVADPAPPSAQPEPVRSEPAEEPQTDPMPQDAPPAVGRPAAASAEDADPDADTGEVVDDEGPLTLDSAVLRWGLSNEANNRSPQGAFNFFSAGRVAKPADGIVPQGGWSAATGGVSVEKWNGSAYLPATWAGLSTDATGATIPNFLSGRYSGHQLVFSGGTGTVDRAAGTAHIEWRGDASVVFYGGMVFFYLSDPVLDVAGGKATLEGTVSGYGSSQDNPGVSFPVDPVRVTLADLPDVTLAELGFTAAPAYDGVNVTAGGQQITGSFPQSFVTAMELFGTAPFWYASGGSLDPAKKALPITVSFSGARPVAPPAPPAETPKPEITNKAKKPPKAKSTDDVPAPVGQTVPAFAAPPPALAAPPMAAVPVAAEPLTRSETIQLVAAPATKASGSGDGTTGWWLGGALFVLATLVVAGALLTPARASGRSA